MSKSKNNDLSILQGSERKRKAKHLVVVSYDAFSEDNWEMASRLPNLSKLIEKGAYSTKLKSVYPTLTYVVHSTMVTGVYPDKHGVNHNNLFQPFVSDKDRSWFWFRDAIKVPTIYDVVSGHNMSTAGLLWPVTGKASIKYNIPEVLAINKENQALKVLKNGNPWFCLNMELKFGGIRKGVEEPYLDDYTTMCAVDTLKRKKPNLLLVHLIDLDDAKHNHGIDSMEVEQTIARMDKRLGSIVKAVDEAGIKDDTVFLIVGDHGQINVKYKVYLNNLLKEEGLIFKENGEMRWRAYFQCGGGTAYLHIKSEDVEAERLAVTIVENAIKNKSYGIERLYSGDERDILHVDKSLKYVIEAKTDYCFEEAVNETTIVNLEEQNIKYATHGYSPDKPNYKCLFIVSGNMIKNDYQLGDIEMIDIAPTMAKILGVDFKNCDGRTLDEIFL